MATYPTTGAAPWGPALQSYIDGGDAAFNAAYVSDLTTPSYLPHGDSATIYPGNTLDLHRGVIAVGSKVVDVDVQLLADGGLAICHDSTVDASTNGTGNVNTFTTAAWRKLTVDASSWFGYGFADSKPLMLDDIITEFGGHQVLSIEPKSSAAVQPVLDLLTRRKVAKSTVWINTFNLSWLAPAVAAGYTCAWNTDDGTTAVSAITAAGATWVGINFPTSSSARVAALTAAGLKVFAWNLSSRADAATALSWGCSWIVTDHFGYTQATSAIMSTDGFANQTPIPGQIPYNGTLAFEAPNWCGFSTAAPGNFRGWLMGYASPMANATGSYTITGTARFDSATATDRFMSIAFGAPNDVPWTGSAGGPDGWVAHTRKDGTLSLYKVAAGVGTLMAQYITTPTAIPDGGTAQIKITVTPTTVKFERTDVAYTCPTVTDSNYRGGYWHVGMQGVVGKWKSITVA